LTENGRTARRRPGPDGRRPERSRPSQKVDRDPAFLWTEEPGLHLCPSVDRPDQHGRPNRQLGRGSEAPGALHDPERQWTPVVEVPTRRRHQPRQLGGREDRLPEVLRAQVHREDHLL